MKKNTSSIFWGLIIILVGIIYLGNNLDLWNIEIFFDGWWTLFIIIPSVIGLFKKEGFVSCILGIIIGSLLLLACQDTIEWNMVGKVFIPLLIIIIGLSILFKPTVKKITKSGKGDTFFGIFSSTEEKLNGKLEELNCISVFGGVTLDLTKTEVKEDVVIDCVTVFGAAELRLPKDANVKTSGVPIFGGLENKKEIEEKKNTPTIYINYVCVFGGVDLL